MPGACGAAPAYNAAMVRRIWVVSKITWLSFARDNCSQLAAAISYYVLFSIVPLAILAVSLAGLIFGGDSVRNSITNRILNAVPLSQTEGRSAVENALDSVKRVSGPVAAAGLLATLWTASAVFASIRKSLNAVWRVDEHRPWAQAKLVDLAQVGLLGAILLASLVLTGVLRTIREISAEHVGPLANRNPLWEVPPIALPALLTLVTFVLLYRIVPASHPKWRDVLPGAILATLLFEVLKNSFAIYVANFNNFDVVYGSLAGALLFLLYTYLSSNILLAGAELTRTMERYHAHELDAELFPVDPQPTVTTRVLQAVRGLFVRQ
jgi:membrane protein